MVSKSCIDAGVESGLSRADAKKIVTQNLIGTGLVLDSSTKHPYQITDDMNTPGGIGIAGFHGIVMDAVQAAYERTTALGK